MPEQNKCFIIQPLSEKYKERCDDTYKPAIEKAGLLPYRVDEDYDAKKLKIQTIRDEIEKSAVCLADITEDNVNVWYEVGFADGHNTPVVLICEKGRREELPFDVNQRDVYFYDTNSQGDWEKLQKEITKRLQIAQDIPVEKAGNYIENSTTRVKSEFGKAALFVFWALHYASENDSNWGIESVLKARMKNDFSQEDVTDALTILEIRKMVDKIFTSPVVGGASDNDFRYWLTDKGKDWCLKNQELVREAGKGK